MKSLRSYLAAIAVLLVLVVCAAAGVLIAQTVALGRAQSQRQLLETTRAMSLAVDGQLQGYDGILSAMLQSRALATEEWAVLDRQARAVLSGPDVWVAVTARDGTQRVNTRLPVGAPLPSGRLGLEMWAALDKGQRHVCDLSHGYVVRDILCLDAPVMRAGRVAYALSVIMAPARLRTIVDRSRLQPGWVATVLDRKGVVIWRNRYPERFLGRKASPELLRAIGQSREGPFRGTSLEGVPAVGAFSRSDLSGWTFVVAAPAEDMAAAGRQALRKGLLAVAVFLAAGGLVGALAGRRIATAVSRLEQAARRIAEGGAPRFQATGLREIDDAGRALEAAIGERDASRERFQLAQEVGGIGSWDWDMRQDEGHVSESYKRMHGLAHVEGPLRIAQVLAVIHPDDLPGYQARLAAAKLKREPSTNEYRVVHADGSVHWIAAKGRPLFEPGGALVGAVGVVRDATAEREALEALKASEARLRLAMVAGRMAVFDWPLDRDDAPLTEELHRLLGVGNGEASSVYDRRARYHPEDAERVNGARRRALESGERFIDFEFRYLFASGETHWFQVRSEVMRSEGGRPERLVGVMLDITEQKRSEERMGLLMREVDHRANNLLTVVQSLVTLSGGDTAEALRSVLQGRVQALARAHQMLAQARWVGADLQRLAVEELAPFGMETPGRIRLEGEPYSLSPARAQGVAMALHELATNAAKYGALSTAGGTLSVTWTTEDGGLDLMWRERGGPAVSPPRRRGVGTMILQRALAGQIQGQVELDWAREGLGCRIRLEPETGAEASEPAGDPEIAVAR